MKYVFMLMLGLLIGAALGVTGLYYNPLTSREAPVPQDADWTLSFGSPLTDGLAFTHGGNSRMPRSPLGVPDLWESTISQSALSVLAMRRADGEGIAALASRISLPSETTDLLTRGLVLEDYWTLTVPGEGTLFLQAHENVWPLIKEAVIPVWYLGQTWQGPRSYRPTAGPGIGNTALLLGATGAFVGSQGSAVDSYELHEFTEAQGPQRLEGSLHLLFVEPEASAASTN